MLSISANKLNTGSKYCNIWLETLDHYRYNNGDLVNVNNPNVANVNDRVIQMPIAPSECMFENDMEHTTLDLLNFGEVSVGMNKKLATWNITVMFPFKGANTRLPYIMTSTVNGVTTIPDGYDYYCSTLYTWQKESTPLVFRLKTWGEYYYCQIKTFKFGRQDYSGWVYADLSFVEFKPSSLYNGESNAEYTTDYPSDYYYPDVDEDICDVCIKLYGTSEAYKYFMRINDMKNINLISSGQYKVR